MEGLISKMVNKISSCNFTSNGHMVRQQFTTTRDDSKTRAHLLDSISGKLDLRAQEKEYFEWL